jgi:threonine/homoserine/homoserine lactone efflux protein
MPGLVIAKIEWRFILSMTKSTSATKPTDIPGFVGATTGGTMTFETWAAFTAASAVLLIVPGPTVLLVVSYALGQGWRTAMPMAIGVALGDFTAMTFSMLGLGALIAASATLFTILKWVGAAYLVYLGIKLWRAGGTLDAAPRTDAVSAAKMLGHAWLVTALNPKGITFFVAFLPAFLDPRSDFLTQMIVFETTFLLLAFANAFGYALVASRARGFVSNPRAIDVVNKVGGSLLVGAGAATVTFAGSRS